MAPLPGARLADSVSSHRKSDTKGLPGGTGVGSWKLHCVIVGFGWRKCRLHWGETRADIEAELAVADHEMVVRLECQWAIRLAQDGPVHGSTIGTERKQINIRVCC